MELLSLKMKNYRRFESETTINFARGEKNVTIIRAENGAGKTGILMALLFGLFGTVHYEQFQIEDDKDFMVSARLLGKDQSASCTVSVNFIEEDSKYTIERTIKASNISGHIQQDNDDVKTKLFKDGIDCGWSKSEIDAFMNSIIGENIRGFLFFDGVKYTDLFKQNNSNTKRELQKIIEKMLNINDLDKTIETLSVLASNISSGNGVSSSTAKKLADAKNELKKLENNISENADKRDRLEKEINDYGERYKALLEKSKNLEGYEQIVKDINEKQTEKQTEEAHLEGYLDAMSKSAPRYLLSGVYSSFGEKSKAIFDSLSQDKNALASIMEMALKENKCICCDNPLTEEQRNHLEASLSELKDGEAVPFEIADRARSNSHHIAEGVSSSFEDDSNKTTSSISKIQDLVSGIAHLESQLPNDQSFDDLNKEMRNLLEQKGSFNTLIAGRKGALDDASRTLNELETKKVELEEKIKNLETEAAKQINAQELYEYYDGTKKKLASLKARYLKEAQEEITERANEFFLKLLSEDDKKSFTSLKLNADYSIKVYSPDGRESFGQMSAGQKLLASMAFVMGLTATASKAKPTCNFPLVMDTPFSNLDSRNRRSLIGLMPDVVEQWILTPIDTELTPNEITFFENGGKVGRVYYLKKDGASTTLVEYDSVAELGACGGIKQ